MLHHEDQTYGKTLKLNNKKLWNRIFQKINWVVSAFTAEWNRVFSISKVDGDSTNYFANYE